MALDIPVNLPQQAEIMSRTHTIQKSRADAWLDLVTWRF